jgi:hypothetical protein
MRKTNVDQEIKALKIASRVTTRHMLMNAEEFGSTYDEVNECYHYGEPWPDGVRDRLIEWIRKSGEAPHGS